MSILAASNLVKLDVSLRDKDGMAPADYMAQRLICVESEEGLRDEYQRLLKCLPAEKVSVSGTSIEGTLVDLESQSDLSECHVPGAFPDHYDEKTMLVQ